jgi:endoplasmic reticulum resident protein 44
MKNWLTDKCIPLVREVTFENVEELTEEGVPFLILFRDPNDKETDKKFAESVWKKTIKFCKKYLSQVARELFDQKTEVNALLADGQSMWNFPTNLYSSFEALNSHIH